MARTYTNGPDNPFYPNAENLEGFLWDQDRWGDWVAQLRVKHPMTPTAAAEMRQSIERLAHNAPTILMGIGVHKWRIRGV